MSQFNIAKFPLTLRWSDEGVQLFGSIPESTRALHSCFQSVLILLAPIRMKSRKETMHH